MKFVNKILLILTIVGVISACDSWDMEQQENPNALDAQSASLSDLYNSIQLGFADQYLAGDYAPGAMARMYMTVAYTYNAAITNNTMNGVWNSAYSGLFGDYDALIEKAGENNFAIHIGSAQVLKAWTMMQLVDLMGDVPYSEAGKGVEFISPKADSGADVYAAAIALLDEAIVNLAIADAPAPALDMIYGGDVAKWTTAAKTLKMRAYLNTGDLASFDAIVSAGDIIDTAGEDFQFNAGSQRVNPNSRHWMYNSHYEVGDGSYLNDYYMWLVAGGEESNGAGITTRDPRARYYFFRKVDDSENQEVTSYGCHYSVMPTQEDRPSHWSGDFSKIPYCYGTTDGYIGRDHMNGEGTPPDGYIRTSYGLYPGGGQFDYDNWTLGFAETRFQGSTGGLGEGILPIMLSSHVKLMQAERKISAGLDASAELEAGIIASMEKVMSFNGLVSTTMGTAKELRNGDIVNVGDFYGITATKTTDYADEVMAAYALASADGKKDIIAKQYLIALWGNGLEAYNMWRRTGLPSNMSPALEADPGPFAYSMYYPTDYISRNGNATQRALTDRVFWNVGGPELY